MRAVRWAFRHALALKEELGKAWRGPFAVSVVGIVGLGLSSRQQDVSASRAAHVCERVCVCALYLHDCYGYDKPRLVVSTIVA